MSKLCSTCLSRDRILISLNKDKYGSLFGSRKVMMRVESICWECNATFRRLLQFKLQVLKAQEFLKTNKEVTDVESLSQIKCSRIITNDVCCEQINLIEEKTILDEVKPNILDADTIKYENEFIDALTNSEFNDLSVQNYLVSGVKPDELMPIDATVIKNENDGDGISDNEMIVEELRIDNFKNRKRKRVSCDVKRSVVNDKSKDCRKLILSKDNYVVIEMTEEEMLAKRDADRQLHRYKNICKYRCDLCISGFFDKDKYERHMKNRHSEKAGNHVCSVCDTRFTKVTYYNEHLESHYRKYRCRVCSFVGYKLTEMASHDAREHGLRRFSCKQCSKEFPSRSSLRFHRDTAHAPPVKCESCGKMFRTKNNLRIHNKVVHKSVPKTQCEVCGARCRHMRVHMQTHGAAPEAAYCAECDKRFSSVAVYRAHLKYAAKHRPPHTLKHQCPFCESKFVNSTGVKKHVLARHSKERPFKCDRCDKGFEAKCKLKLHILHDHEGVEKPKNKICHICGRGFNTKFMLSNHIRVHTGEKPFRCEICSAAFSQKSSLATHTRGVHLKLKTRPARSHSNRNLE